MADFIVVALSAGLGFAVGRVERWRDRRSRRKAVATALLIELRWVESGLRTLVEHDRAAQSTRRLLTDVYDRFESDIVLFKSVTAQSLLQLRGLIRDIENSREIVRGLETANDDRTHHYFRVKAAFAARLVPELRKRLEAEGGALPPMLPVQKGTYPDVPSLPPPAFPDEPEQLKR